MSRLAAIPALLFALFLQATAARAQDAAAFYRQGVDRQRAGDLAGAADLYRQSLALNPDNIAARSNLGAALTGLARYDEAVPEYEKALRAAPEAVRPYLQRNLGLAWYKSGQLRQASELFLALHAAQPANLDATMLAADCFLQLGEPARALSLLEPAASGASPDKAFTYLLGMAYLRNGKAAEAQRVLDPILRDTASAEGNYALGLAMFTTGDFPAAMQALGRAARLNPALPRVNSYYGQSLVFTGDPEGALAAFSRQLALDPNDYEANFESALILNRRAKYAQAEPLLRRALSLRPKSAPVRLALGAALLGAGKLPEARAALELTVRDSPQYGMAYARLAEVYAKTGRPADAARERLLAAKFTSSADSPAPVGPKPGTPAPPLELARAEGEGVVRVPAPGKPTVLVFGSYTCPNFRSAAPVLNELSKTYGSRASFLLVYIREAHATDTWQSTINEREHVELAPPSSLRQKHEYAGMCVRRLRLSFPAAVDALDNAAEQAYSAWPSRVFVIGADGRVVYSSALIEEEFDRAALEAAIRSALPKSR